MLLCLSYYVFFLAFKKKENSYNMLIISLHWPMRNETHRSIDTSAKNRVLIHWYWKIYPKLMLSLVICRPGVFRKKEEFAVLTTDLHIGIGHNKTTRKKGNPSALKAWEPPIPVLHIRFDVVANESEGGGALLAKESLPHSGAQFISPASR